ncbi:MAG: hypothetical protein Q8M76_07325, partial [Spirochaetaceae bacterium]|nr:hypothetical protein [Spirochaetaceae bacterium]
VAYDAETIYILLGRLINRIVGDTASIDQINRYTKADVAGLTNGDFGISSFITNELPESNHHYKYDHVSVFYKRGYGIVFQLITAKKLEFFKSQTFIDALKSFKYPGIKNK